MNLLSLLDTINRKIIENPDRYEELVDIWLKKDFPKHRREGYRIGGSQIGGECRRFIFYALRKFVKPEYTARITRLFNRGTIEERRVFALLELVGVEFHTHNADGKQFACNIDFSLSGNIDGIVMLDYNNETIPFILEIKTMGDKYFRRVEQYGVQQENTSHYDQMQTYMLGFGISNALYFVVNKNTDDIYLEHVRFYPEYVDELVAKAEDIITAIAIPLQVSETPSFYKCKMCVYAGICHFNKPIIKGCNTCVKSSIKDNILVCTRHTACEMCDDYVDFMYEKL